MLFIQVDFEDYARSNTRKKVRDAIHPQMRLMHGNRCFPELSIDEIICKYIRLICVFCPSVLIGDCRMTEYTVVAGVYRKASYLQPWGRLQVGVGMRYIRCYSPLRPRQHMSTVSPCMQLPHHTEASCRRAFLQPFVGEDAASRVARIVDPRRPEQGPVRTARRRWSNVAFGLWATRPSRHVRWPSASRKFIVLGIFLKTKRETAAETPSCGLSRIFGSTRSIVCPSSPSCRPA